MQKILIIVISFIFLIGFLNALGYIFIPPFKVEMNLTDTTPPKWWNATQSANVVKPGETVTLTVRATDNLGLKEAKLNMSVDKWIIKDIQKLSGKGSLVIFRYIVPPYEPETKISWNIIILDKNDNRNITDTLSFIVADAQPPEIAEVEQEKSEIVPSESNLLSAKISDNFRLAEIAFQTNESGKFETIRKYNITEKGADVSIQWTNPKAKPGTLIGWRVFAADAWNNTAYSDVLTFKIKGCDCGAPSEWSECINGTQKQLYYECGKHTNYTCMLRTRTKECIPGISKSEAANAIKEAESAIKLAKEENRIIDEAQKLLEDAQNAYYNGDWSEAKDFAIRAKKAAKIAEIKKPPKPNMLPTFVFVVLAILLVTIMYKFGKLHIPLAKRAPPEAIGKGGICGVCGKRFESLYTCAECGTKVCYDDARTWQGKVYCLACLKKKGLI